MTKNEISPDTKSSNLHPPHYMKSADLYLHSDQNHLKHYYHRKGKLICVDGVCMCVHFQCP